MTGIVFVIVVYSAVVAGLLWLLPRVYELGYEEGKEAALEELKDLYWTGQIDKPGDVS